MLEGEGGEELMLAAETMEEMQCLLHEHSLKLQVFVGRHDDDDGELKDNDDYDDGELNDNDDGDDDDNDEELKDNDDDNDGELNDNDDDDGDDDDDDDDEELKDNDDDDDDDGELNDDDDDDDDELDDDDDDDDGKLSVPDTERRCAAGCDDALKSGHDQVYACEPCGFYLHQSCSDLPRRIEHSFHPCPLFLKVVPARPEMVLSYRCEVCDFEMDAASGQRFQASSSSSLLHFSHQHPLQLMTTCEEVEAANAEPSSKEKEDAELRCNGCNKSISGKSYACHSCGYYLHESCANLPHRIRTFFHPCTLFLDIVDNSFMCDVCEGYLDKTTFWYRSRKCGLRVHPECCMVQPAGPRDEDRRWFHEHPLQLFGEETKATTNTKCWLCSRQISSGQTYAACQVCQFSVHESCMESPLVIRHRCHPCPLVLRPCKIFQCHTCLNYKSEWRYQCLKCHFLMDVECALFSQEITEGDRADHLLHFCHHHPLRRFEDPKKDAADRIWYRKLECLVCHEPASGLTYGCKQCDVYLHKPCLDVLPQTISIGDRSFFLSRLGNDVCEGCRGYQENWSFIPYGCQSYNWCVRTAMWKILSFKKKVSPSSVSVQLHFHQCLLTLKLFPTFTCNACFTHCHSHAYYCDQCDFYVGTKCVQLCKKSSNDIGEERRLHFCHRHPLQGSQDAEASTASCRVCGSICLHPFYFCSDCDFHVHESCLDILPQNIDHHYLNCSLLLLTTPSYRCASCQTENESGLTFSSIGRGGFKLCIECVLWPKNKLNDNNTFKSIHHLHPLVLTDKLEEDVHCLLCRRKISTLAYCCSQCDGYFHKTCAEFPLEMQHPLHKQHQLTLISSHLLPESSRNCSLCQRDLFSDDPRAQHSGVYHCKECSFQLDKECATRFPSILYQGHPHPLTVVESMQGWENCRICSASCKDRIVFRCAEVECKFVLHLSCGPLPCKIKHSCHVHPLVLQDFYVEDNYTDLFPCHVCEERRDPRLPVYQCAEDCPMICEIECVISEVMPKLLGAHGDVELRTTFPNVASKVIIKDKGSSDMPYDSEDGDSQGTLSTRDLDLFLRRQRDVYIGRGI